MSRARLSRLPPPDRLLPDTAAVGDDGSLADRRLRASRELAAEFGTPLFVYDEAHLRARCREAVAAVRRRTAPSTPPRRSSAWRWRGSPTRRACGSTSPPAASCTSPSPQGCRPARACCTATTRASPSCAGRSTRASASIVVDSFDELDRLDALHAGRRRSPVPDVLLRITPGVHAHTHEFIATGQDDSKFGFNLGNGDAMRGRRTGRRSIGDASSSGVHCHIGSQRLRRIELRQGRRGDGRASPRRSGCPSWCSAAGSASPTSTARKHRRSRSGATSARCVPGARCHVAGQRRARSVDRGRRRRHGVHGRHDQAHPRRAHLRRRRRRDERQPAPGALRQRLRGVPAPRAPFAERSCTARLVGKHCESGDVLLFDAAFPPTSPSATCWRRRSRVPTARSMGSQLQQLTRPPVVFVADGEARLVIRRETFDDLLATDVG